MLSILLPFSAVSQISHVGIERDLEALQKEFLSWRFGMFIHFNMGTFSSAEWANGYEDPLLFDPVELDCGQWADAAASANMRYAILTVKHTGGWCLWNSAYTDHDIEMFQNYNEGKGDIVREFCEAFRSRGLKIGLYYCFPLHHKEWAKYSTLPIKGYENSTCDALGFVKNQFKELLTNYGKIDLIWIDQYSSLHGGMKEGDWLLFKEYIHSLQPECIVMGNNAQNLNESDIIGYEYPWSHTLPPDGNTIPSEVCDKLQNSWFSSIPRGEDAPPIRDIDYIVSEMLIPLNRKHSNYLLNCAPNDRGLMPESVVRLLKEVGQQYN